MPLHALLQPRIRPAIAVATTLAAVVGVVSVAPAPQAHAESGRRICRYLWSQGVGNPDGRMVSFVADYKKKGSCPIVDPHKVSLPKTVGSWMPPPDTWEHQPAPKITCEAFGHSLALPRGGRGNGDPCTYMTDDVLYAVTSYLPGDTSATKRFWHLGRLDDLGY